MSKKIVQENFKKGDKVECIALVRIPEDVKQDRNTNYLEGPSTGGEIIIGRTYTVDASGGKELSSVYKDPVIMVKGKNNYWHLASNFKKIRKNKK
jgi:hypothetical protein